MEYLVRPKASPMPATREVIVSRFLCYKVLLFTLTPPKDSNLMKWQLVHGTAAQLLLVEF